MRPAACARCGAKMTAAELARHERFECAALLTRRAPGDLSMFDPRCELVLHAAARARRADGVAARLAREEMNRARVP